MWAWLLLQYNGLNTKEFGNAAASAEVIFIVAVFYNWYMRY